MIENLKKLTSPVFEEVLSSFKESICTDFTTIINEDLTETENDKKFYMYNKFYSEWLAYLKDSKSKEVYHFESLIKMKFEQVLLKYGSSFGDSMDFSVFFIKKTSK